MEANKLEMGFAGQAFTTTLSCKQVHIKIIRLMPKKVVKATALM